MNILLTGGFGFLGGRLAIELLQQGHAVTLGSRTPRTAPAWATSARVVGIDLGDDDSLEDAVSGMDVVIHLAGMNAAACANDPVAAIEVNAAGTARLVRAAVVHGVPRLLYISTAHVYGAALTGTVVEGTCALPSHPYATSRRAAEDVVRAAYERGALGATIVRLSNGFGAPADAAADCWMLFANDLCLQAVRDRRMVLRTAGTQRRDFVPMSEACRAIAHLAAMPRAALPHCVFHVGSRWAPRLAEMAELLASRAEAQLGVRPQIQLGSALDPVGDGPLDYRIDRLLASGFQPIEGAAVAEIDRLVAFCIAEARE